MPPDEGAGLLGDQRQQRVHREVGADHGGAPEQIALGRAQPVEASGEEAPARRLGRRPSPRPANAATICSTNSGFPWAISTMRVSVSGGSVPPASRSAISFWVSVEAERLEEQGVGVAPLRSPCGTLLDELGSRQAEQEDRVRAPVGEVLDRGRGAWARPSAGLRG